MFRRWSPSLLRKASRNNIKSFACDLTYGQHELEFQMPLTSERLSV